MKLGIVFAGQGSQKAGMGKDFYEKSEIFKSVFDNLSEKHKTLAFEGPADELSDTRNTQPVMVAFALGVFRMLEKEGIKPAMAAGLSLGEYSALAASGVFSDEEAIDVVEKRGILMSKAAEGVDCEMAAVMNLSAELLKEACDEASALGTVQIANYNCPGQIVIAGEKAAVQKASELAVEKGARRCIPLAVSGPFHTSFMKPAGDGLDEIFSKMQFGDMSFPVIFNATGSFLKDGETIRKLLVKQVQSSVRFEDTIRLMAEEGVDTILEIGPGKALSGFVRKTDKNIKSLNIDIYEDFEKVAEILKGTEDER